MCPLILAYKKCLFFLSSLPFYLSNSNGSQLSGYVVLNGEAIWLAMEGGFGQ